MLTPPTPPNWLEQQQRQSAIHRLLDRWRKRRERIKRLNAARSRKSDWPGPSIYG
jgi:hypothetical protein